MLISQGRGFGAELEEAIFSDYSQAKRAASWAVDTGLGGFINVCVHATDKKAQFRTAEECFN